MGYFCFVGVEGMIYKENGVDILHPVVDISVRNTLIYNILSYYQRWCADALVRASFTKDFGTKQLIFEIIT